MSVDSASCAAERLCAAQEALLAALDEGADAARLERAFAACSAAFAAAVAGPEAIPARARQLAALLEQRVAAERDATTAELAKARSLRRWLAARRLPPDTGETCDVRG